MAAGSHGEAPKCRRQAFSGEKKQGAGKMTKTMGAEGRKHGGSGCCSGHARRLWDMPPETGVSSHVGAWKGKRSLMPCGSFGAPDIASVRFAARFLCRCGREKPDNDI